MPKQSKDDTLIRGWIVSTVFLMICLAGLSGCSGTHGRLAINSDVKGLFERNEVLPDHHYFYSGLAPHPRAIIGLHKDYVLQSDYWNPVELTPEKLHQWLRFQKPNRKYLIYNNGSDILDPEDRKIGVWYGLKGAHDWAVVTMLDEKTVTIAVPTPQMDVLRPYPGHFTKFDQ